MKIGIVGYGHVGKAMHNLFKNAYINDKDESILKQELKKFKNHEKMDAIFICVPTPMKENGSCNTSFVEEVLEKFKANIFIIRSTVYVGFTEYSEKKFNKKVVFQPEYYGETTNHPFSDLNNQNWISFGGKSENINLAIEVYKEVKNSNIKIIQGPSRDIEFAKYMENLFFANKVTFINEMYDVAKSLKVNYNIAREAWIADPRIGTSHTFVYPEKRGYGGSCLPKDISSLIFQAKENNVNVDLLEKVVEKNKKYQKNNK